MTQGIREAFQNAWAVIGAQMAGLLPKLLVGILILLIGSMLARLIRALAFRVFVAIRLDRLSDRLGVNAFLARGDARHTVAGVFATLVYWFVLVFSLEVLSKVLGLEGVSSFLGQVVGYLPRLAVALAITIVGIVIASFFGGAIQVAAANAGFPAPGPLGRAIKYLIALIALVMALEQAQIGTRFLTTTLDIVIAAVGLALALAFGLGCKDLARDAVRNWLNREQPEEDRRTDRGRSRSADREDRP